jgi:hypothetical protein
MRRSLLRKFLGRAAASGILLIGMAAVALILVDTPLAWLYHGLLADRRRPGRRTQDQQAAVIDQRRIDGPLLPADRAGKQAGGARGQAAEPAPRRLGGDDLSYAVLRPGRG